MLNARAVESLQQGGFTFVQGDLTMKNW